MKARETPISITTESSFSSSCGDDVYQFDDHLRRFPLISAILRKYKKALIIGFSLLFSICFSLYNSVILNKSQYDLGVPLFTALIYELTQFLLAAGWIMCSEWRSGPGLMNSYLRIEPSSCLKFLLPCGIAAALNIALSNFSLQVVSLSFYTMVKSSSLLFLLTFAFIFGLERPSTRLSFIMMLLFSGLILTVYSPSAFNATGFTLVIAAAVSSSFRWALTQVIVQKSTTSELGESCKMFGSGPLHTIIFLGPVIISVISLLCLILEGPRAVKSSLFFKDAQNSMIAFGFCIFGGVQCFILNVLEYQCIQLTSVLTLFVSGIVKEISIITIAVVFFNDPISPINIIGATLSIMGILLYGSYTRKRNPKLTITKRQKLEEEALHTLCVGIAEPPWILEPLGAFDTSLCLADNEVPQCPARAIVKCNSFMDAFSQSKASDVGGVRLYRSTSFPTM